MADTTFHEGPLPPDFTLDFEESLFNSEDFRLLHHRAGWQSLYALNPTEKTAVAALHFFLAEGIAKSPARAPFGSVECAGDISPSLLFQFLEFVEQRLLAAGATQIVIKCPPQAYAPVRATLLHTFFANLGYTVHNAEVGAVLPVKGSYVEHVDSWEKRKLKQALASGLELRDVAPDQLETIYRFILDCRAQKGYALSMPLADVTAAAEKFPDHFLPFGVYQGETLVAASLAVRVYPTVLYNFYSDHNSAFDHLSPVVLLLNGLYDYCTLHNITQLDLGTSAVDGKPNFGLLDFKMRLGGVPTPKLTFAKNISR